MTILIVGDRHSSKYPSYLPQDLDIELISERGVSNDRLCKIVIDKCENNEYEYVVVQWGSWGRVEVFQDGEWRQLKPIQYLKRKPENYELAKIWYTKIDTEHLRSTNLWKNIYVLESYLNKRGIKHFFWMVRNNYEPVGRVVEDLTYLKQNHQTDPGNIFRDLSSWKNIQTDVSLTGIDMKRDDMDHSQLSKAIFQSTNNFKE